MNAIQRIMEEVDHADKEKISLNVRDVKLLLIEWNTWQTYAKDLTLKTIERTR